MPKKIRLDLIGQKFNRLLVMAGAGNNKWKSSLWLCKCDCGIEKIVIGSSLMSGKTQSCGCYMRERNSEIHTGKIVSAETKQKQSKACIGIRTRENNPNYKHGLYGTDAYNNQQNAKRRARKLNQTPANADMEKIQKIYDFCGKLNKAGFLKYQVDHIIPLSKGGLHHEDNLQILWADLNHRKQAKITDEYQGITLKDLERSTGGKKSAG